VRWRIGVDIGGTFTDLVLVDESGVLRVVKVPSTPREPAEGVMSALEAVAGTVGLKTTELLRECELFVHGSTIATNTMLEGKGAKVAMITTEGFRDSLEIRRGARENSWDHRTPFAPVLVPRSLRFGLPGRIDRDGEELLPVDDERLAEAASLFRDEAVEAIAVCLLNSFLNPSHEQHVAQALRAQLPNVWVSLSCEVAPIIGEYERGSTTVVNACLAPKVIPYLRQLDKNLREAGLRHPMLLVQSNAGAASVEQVAERPAALLLSGPAAAVGSLEFVAEQVGSRNLISMEIGGTSCDVVMMNNGEVAVSEDSLIAGYHVALPTIDVHTVGAGGGTIAGVDAGGMLKVGPQGAGAVPGPACYGLGGDRATVTDALLVLGRLAPGAYADGAVSLDPLLAERALREDVAAPLNVSLHEAAIGIVSILEQNLLHAVERISIERGHDPRACVLVAAGGAGPMHGSAVARSLGCARVYVPRQAGAFCALGMLNADVRHDVMRVFIEDLDTVDEQVVNEAFEKLCVQAAAAITAEGFGPELTAVERQIGLHYAGQQSSIRVSAPNFERGRLRADFEASHQRMFGHIQPEGALQITDLYATGVGSIARLKPLEDTRLELTPTPVTTRDVFCDVEHGVCPTNVYRGETLTRGVRLDGPVLIEESTTTLFVGPLDKVSVDKYGNYCVDIGGL